jgi:endonuclease VIII-like 1
MPELAEVKLTADYVNKMVRGKKFDRVRKNPSHKGKLFDHPDLFEISAVSRGKEFKLLLNHQGGTEHLLMTMGMSGYFKLTPFGEEVKHSHLMFDSTDGTTLSFVDVRRFGKWGFGDWNKLRGPDPVYEHEEFYSNIMNNLEKKDFYKPLHEVLMNQKYFNGIGNYLRAEIVYRLEDVDPFQPAKNAIKGPKGKILLDLCKEIPHQAYLLGGGNLYTWETPQELEIHTSLGSWTDWMKCYGNKSMASEVDNIGRRFWYDSKWKRND